MSGIIPFDYETNAVRVVMIDDEPWFVAADVCRVLAHTNPTVALSRLDDDEKQRLDPKVWLGSSVAGGGAQTINVVSESGLFALILTSNKPEAKRFRKWVTAEVLPAIRQNGAYAVPRQQLAELELKREYYRSLPEDQKARADRKAVAVRRVNELVSEGYRRRDAIDIVAEEAGMGARTIWAARRQVWPVVDPDFEFALAPLWRANTERDMLAECHPDAMIRWLQLNRAGVGVSDSYRRLLGEAAENGWAPVPCERTMRRALRRLGMNKVREVAHV